ncbi:MAG: toll/interleukin-1 receptor domain-containing protein [Anaerolineales bacterium]
MIRVFISYAHEDSSVIDNIQSHLDAAGYAVWIDRESIAGGELWRARIVEAIENSNVFLLILSPNSVKSKHVLQELNIADGESKPILPVLIGAAEIPREMKLQLAGLQAIMLETNDFSNIDVLYKSIHQLAST